MNMSSPMPPSPYPCFCRSVFWRSVLGLRRLAPVAVSVMIYGFVYVLCFFLLRFLVSAFVGLLQVFAPLPWRCPCSGMGFCFCPSLLVQSLSCCCSSSLRMFCSISFVLPAEFFFLRASLSAQFGLYLFRALLFVNFMQFSLLF